MKTGKVDKPNNLDGKRGKKGGTQFPRYSLSHLIPLLKNLVSKTHTNGITLEQLNAGVFGIGAKSTIGSVKSSALKQFGLLIAKDYKNMKASDLASQISMAEGDEQKKYLQAAFKNSSVLVNAFTTFHNSRTEKSKIGQYAVSTLKVHPDMKDDFVGILVESAVIAGLATADGNTVNFSNFSVISQTTSGSPDIEENEDGDKVDDNESPDSPPPAPHLNPTSNSSHTRSQGQVSNINVNIDVDPSMDPEKLEKLLKLLKNYGAI